ncbi:uncharacterized protein TRAVEDRAFT_112621 [Trametes versicolor FP-101664 SS1]|uniref:uncharacterized protein n=1 Tax=Trametes versicolor (strain FP-101664) TaxID=717944 RepID=UPI00046212D4|nr:uncharacterized protein TRAVEDRAFT_112621 [Trametes versicolor FP-101664 SS1]EIW62718.1 hypothetical protein TRAVEDRAFT_112621 [Trametes versicolor FP-101664 SS1]
MPAKALVNPAHTPGHTCIAFSRDGSRVYTGGADSLVRIWDTALGEDQEPPCATEALEEVTAIAAAPDCWISGSKDSDVRQYEPGKPNMRGLLTNNAGIPIRSVAVDPKGKRVAVTSDETTVKVIDLEDITKMTVLEGHTKAVRKATWHPSGSLLTTCGADGKIIAWDVSGSEPKQEKVIEGVLPVAGDSEAPEFGYDCSAVWHTSGQYFFVATRTHEIATISRSDWSKSSTLSDDACTGDITALALSSNGVYLAAASKSGIFIWSTQNRRMLFRYQGALNAPITQMAFSPLRNLLAWTDTEGDLTRWPDPIPSSAPDPVKNSAGTNSVTVPVKRKGTPTLFDDDNVAVARPEKQNGDVDLDEDLGIDLDNDDWILDDMDGALNDDGEAKRLAVEGGVKEMVVSVTKAQPAFQPGSTPMENKKRYLAYNMVGVIEVTDQDTHHIVNVEFHDRSLRKSYHFTDHFRYDIASLGERGALYACQPEAEHAAHVIYKPYGTWASQSEWTYELPTGTRVLGIAAGGPPPSKSLRDKSDVDGGGQGNVVLATSDGELVFLTGSGIERACLSMPGDFVTMVAGSEWVFIVSRDGSTTMDGSQNLTGRLIKFDDFCVLQKDALPIPKRHTLKWVGITEEGAPAMYDSSGVLHLMPRFRIPLSATWMRVLDTNKLERREGKHESYWPVGLAGEAFMCLILKGRQAHPGFPRPLIQELAIRLPFKRTDPKEAPLEEHFARETMLLDILRDGLGEDELTTDALAARELALDKELIQLIQHACKTDRLARALDLARLLHLTPSFDMAIKVAGFYHLLGLQEKLEALKADRAADDRLEGLRDRRRGIADDFAPVPAMRLPGVGGEGARPKAFQDFRPPPALHRPGLERAQASGSGSGRGNTDTQMTDDATVYGGATQNDGWGTPSPDGKRKRPLDEETPRARSPGLDSGAKRRAIGDSASTARAAVAPQPRSNPFARKPAADNNRNPFARSADTNKSVHKSESFFVKVDAAEADKGKQPKQSKAKPKEKEKKEVGRQTTLFGLPPAQPAEKKTAVRKKKAGTPAGEESQDTASRMKTQTDTQTDIPMEESQAETEGGGDTQVDEPSQVPTEVESQVQNTDAMDAEDAGTPIEWPESPELRTRELEAVA